MTSLKRRQFLQFAGSTLGAIGMSQLDLMHQGDRYGKVLAQGSPGRKLALLVGINGYKNARLNGCVTDVLLQRELLVHRFGFNPKDILIVSDDKTISSIHPTRANLLTTFEEHLIGQAKEDDVVVFHFSGHGATVYDPNSGYPDELNGTLVPIDRTEDPHGNNMIVSDIMGETLFLLQSLLKANQFTAVLDSCYSGGGKRGNLTVRAIDGGANYKRSPAESNYQEKLRTRLGLSLDEVTELRQQGIAKGNVISSTARHQLAADTPFNGFHAGAFTYALTQYLWQSEGDEAVKDIINSVSRSTTQISSTLQVPEFEPEKSRNQVYYIPRQLSPAEAVITKAEGDEVELWLGGINPQALAAFGKGSIFHLLNDKGQVSGKVQLTEERRGLKGSGKLLSGNTRSTLGNSLKEGLLLQEEVRALPNDLPLKLGLAESLTAAERQVAQRELPKLGKYQTVFPLNQTEVQYLLGRMTPEIQAKLPQTEGKEIPALGSLGLYSPGLEMIPQSFAGVDESVEDALERLAVKLRSLLAARLIKLVLNAHSSQMDVSTEFRVKGEQQGTFLAQHFTPRGKRGLQKAKQGELVKPKREVKVEHGVLQVPLGSEIEIKVHNNSEEQLYVTVLVIDPTGAIVPLFPNSFSSGVADALIPAGEVRTLPDHTNSDSGKRDLFRLMIQEPVGMHEVLVVASAVRLRDALKLMETQAAGNRHVRGTILNIAEPLELINSLQRDITRNSRGIGAYFAPDIALAAGAKISAMSVSFNVVEEVFQ